MSTYTSLQRRPFLTPLWLLALMGMAGTFLLISIVWLLLTADSTTVIVIRHAEKTADAVDPPLSATGEARAQVLARMFGDARQPGHLDAIYVSPPLRNRLTAAPLAGRLGLVPIVAAQSDVRGLARRILHEHSGGRVLIVGHMDTVPALVSVLSGAADIPPLGAEEYGTMYIVTVPRIGHANFVRLSY
jgi:broad specificity phosphatase PhoE